jgi:hypothetical protein
LGISIVTSNSTPAPSSSPGSVHHGTLLIAGGDAGQRLVAPALV